MCQQVNVTTHRTGGLLDVIVTRCDEQVSDIVVTETGVSDHQLVTCRLPVTVMSSEYLPTVGRKWNEFSLDVFRAELSKSMPCCNDREWMKSVSIDELFAIYNSELVRLIDVHAPQYIRRRKRRLLTPWFDDECRMLKRNVRRLERKYRKSRQQADRLAWVLKVKEQAIFHQQKERLYWSARIISNAANPKRLWRDLDDLMKRTDESPAASQIESTQRAEEFGNYFDTKVAAIRHDTEQAAPPSFETYTDQQFVKFTVTSPAEITKLILAASNKCCCLDPVPTDLVKNCVDLLGPYITDMFNRSLTDGYVPPSQKVAHVTPHLKKRGLDITDSKNFRPVSNLSLLSKLLEKVVAGQLNGFLNITNTLPSTQSAYRKFHSTETALLKVFSDLCKAVDDGNTCLLGLLDLSSAFDTVDHNILLTRLDVSFGVKSTALEWFQSYLTDRTQVVRVAGCSSKTSRLRCGVPQGSILGPLLFIIYASPVIDIIRRHGLLSHCYADDTQLHFYCAPDQMDSLILTFSKCIADLELWMASNRLKLNCDKTEFAWIASRYRFNALHNQTPVVNIGNSVISPSTGA